MEDQPYGGSVSGFFFCVWSAPTPEGQPSEREAVYLRHRAEAHIVQELLAPLYESEGISLLTSDDEVIPPQKLAALEAAVRSIAAGVERQPATWHVQIGNRLKPFKEEFGEPIYCLAERERLLKFLLEVLTEIDVAKCQGHYLIWAGGT